MMRKLEQVIFHAILCSRVFLITVCILVCNQSTFAQSPEDGRCEWANCDNRSQSSGDFTAINRDHRCDSVDRSACADSCIEEFGPDYKKCTTNCLTNRCNDEPESKSDKNKDGARVYCVEIESAECEDSCRAAPQREGARCRRDCLAQRCPDASQIDIGKESLDPGSLTCSRCKEGAVEECRRDCAMGVYITGRYPGLAEYGCQKACELARCGSKC